MCRSIGGHAVYGRQDVPSLVYLRAMIVCLII